MRPTISDVEKTQSGYWRLPCDGRHHTPYMGHLYAFYTREEVLALWDEEHPDEVTKKRQPLFDLTTWANGFGVWHCRIDFRAPGLGNTPEAERIKYRAMDAAKRRIRSEIVSRESAPIRRLSYEVTENKIDSLNRMWSITIKEA